MTNEELEQALAHGRSLREAAEAERVTAIDRLELALLERDGFKDYATRLLAALVAQRQALGLAPRLAEVATDAGYTTSDGGVAQLEVIQILAQVRTALSTNHAALVAEGETLGVTP